MPAQMTIDQHTELIKRASIQKVPAGPEYSKDLSFDEAHAAQPYPLQLSQAGPWRIARPPSINGIWLINQQCHNLFQNPD
jgi:hypothetical protein